MVQIWYNIGTAEIQIIQYLTSPLLYATKGLESFLIRLSHILNFPLDCDVVLSTTILHLWSIHFPLMISSFGFIIAMQEFAPYRFAWNINSHIFTQGDLAIWLSSPFFC